MLWLAFPSSSTPCSKDTPWTTLEAESYIRNTTLALIGISTLPAHAEDHGILAAKTLGTQDGREIYAQICQGCHMPDASGAIGAGHYPALAKNRALASRQYMALTLLQGRRNMPAFSPQYAIGFVGPPVILTDPQIAAVINYVRTHFGNHYRDAITVAEVAALEKIVR